MTNRERIVGLQHDFIRKSEILIKKEDYAGFKKEAENYIDRIEDLNSDINAKDLKNGILPKIDRVKTESQALQMLHTLISDISILSMNESGDPIFTNSEFDDISKKIQMKYSRAHSEIYQKSFPLIKGNNRDRLHSLDRFKNTYLGKVKNYKDKVFENPYSVDNEQRELFNTLKNDLEKIIFDSLEEDRKILLSYVHDVGEHGKEWVKGRTELNDRFRKGMDIQRGRVNESLDIQKLEKDFEVFKDSKRRDLDRSNERNIENTLYSIERYFELYVKGIEDLMLTYPRSFNTSKDLSMAERSIGWGVKNVEDVISATKRKIEELIVSGFSKDEELFYSISQELGHKVEELRKQKDLQNAVNENHLNEDKESLEKINQVFDTFKGEVNELLKDYEDDMKDNFEDEFKKLLEKLSSRFHDIMSSDDYVAFDKEEKVISSMFIDYCDELNTVVAGCLNAFKSNCINASNRFKAGMRNVRSLTDREVAEQGIKRFIDSILTMVKNIERSKSFSKEYEKKYRRSFEEIINNHIWGGDMQFASGSKKLEEKLRNLLFKDDIFSMGVTSDILKNIALSVNGVDISKDKLLTSVKSQDLVRESKQRLLGKVDKYGESYKEVAEHSILPIFYNLKNDAKLTIDPIILGKNFVGYTEKAEKGGTYSKFLESYKKDIFSAVDNFYKDFTKITNIKIDSEKREFENKVNDILKEYSDIFPYGAETYFNTEIGSKLSDDKDGNIEIIEECNEAYGEEISNIIFYEIIHENVKKEIEKLIDGLNNYINENKVMNRRLNETDSSLLKLKERLAKDLNNYYDRHNDDARQYVYDLFNDFIYDYEDYPGDENKRTVVRDLKNIFLRLAKDHDAKYSRFMDDSAKDVISIVDAFIKAYKRETGNNSQADQAYHKFTQKLTRDIADKSSMFPDGSPGRYFDDTLEDVIRDVDILELGNALVDVGDSLADSEFADELQSTVEWYLGDLLEELGLGTLNERKRRDTTITEPIFESRLNRNDILSVVNHGVKPINESSSSEKVEKIIKKIIKDFSTEGREEKYYSNYHFLDEVDHEFDMISRNIADNIEDGSIPTQRLIDKLIERLIDISIDHTEKRYIRQIYERKEDIFEEIDNAVEEYNNIVKGDGRLLKGEAFKSKYEIDSLVNDNINKVKNELRKIRTSLSAELKQMYTENSTLESIKKYQDSRGHYLWVDGILSRIENFIVDLHTKTFVPKLREIFNNLSFEFGISPSQVNDDITNWYRKVEYGNKLILKKYLRNGMGDQFDIFIKRKYRRLSPSEIGLSHITEFVKGEYEAYSMELNNIVVEILNGYDVNYRKYSRFKDLSDTARRLAKDFQKEKWVYRSFFVKHSNMIEECIEDFLSAYQKGDYHDERWSYPYDDWYKDRNFYRVVIVELKNAYNRSIGDRESKGKWNWKDYSTVMDEAEDISGSRRGNLFEAEEEKKPKISKEEKDKLKAQLDNFFADKKEAKATEIKKSISDRDEQIDEIITKYSSEKEKIQREYSKSIQSTKSEAEANKLRAERDEKLQRLSLDKATAIEEAKERQKHEEAKIREKYQTLLDKKIKEYKDQLGDAISDFAKDIEKGVTRGFESNPIFQ